MMARPWGGHPHQYSMRVANADPIRTTVSQTLLCLAHKNYPHEYSMREASTDPIRTTVSQTPTYWLTKTLYMSSARERERERVSERE